MKLKTLAAAFAVLACAGTAAAQYYQQPMQQQPYGQPMMQQPYGQPMQQPMMQQPMMQQPMQPQYGQPMQQMPMQPQYGQPMMQQPMMPQPMTSFQDAMLAGGVLIVQGQGAAPSDRPLNPAQQKLLAFRAAEVVAQRTIAEILNGVAVSGETVVKDMAAASDVIRSTVQGMVKGARRLGQYDQWSPMEGLATITMQLNLFGAGGAMAPMMPQIIASVPAVPQYRPAAPAAPADGIDALIIDVRGTSFKPALINRIVTGSGEAVYDPAKIEQSVLIKKGCGDYTNDEGKARANYKNPIVIKAKGVIKGTDVEVGPDEASAIFSANQRGQFLAKANVVFLLN